MTTATDRWLPFPRPAGAVRLYCVPHAGGGASSFRPWIGAMPGVAVCPLQPPAREARFRDEPIRTMEQMATEIADVLQDSADGPYAVYGHSLGALTAFEAVRELRRRDAQMPLHLFVSGCPAPQVRDSLLPNVHEASDAEVVALLRRLGGTPESLLNDPGLLGLILPAIRADLEVKETYRYPSEPPLDLPLTVLHADGDPRAGAAATAAWREQAGGEFVLHTVGQGHFAVFEQARITHKYLLEALTPWL
ncbi:Thioesterase [Catenulispora acidiphila DSM 44928]|uniref:Thioesterase n=1 Tax=Catenulispora acidiphila (strain DSM 44928 / JCM 14897 / NBRC 102108 / NRRL B-24433 / ID139908) TaxID=479433 RepID=C7Q570_CATAD|nr:thioesterase domain-containing protein [Catenulispora acidiphila]ACU75839.1 Thioesterase [Catenulispora acidiphila DSM 44928]